MRVVRAQKLKEGGWQSDSCGPASTASSQPYVPQRSSLEGGETSALSKGMYVLFYSTDRCTASEFSYIVYNSYYNYQRAVNQTDKKLITAHCSIRIVITIN